MTSTPTTDLQSVLSAKRAEIDGPPPATEYPVEVIPPADPRTGEIVSAPQHGLSPPAPTEGHPPAPGSAVAPAPPPDYSMIPAKVLGGIPYASEYARLAKTICNTEMVPAPMRGAWDKVMAAFMRGYEMGLGPMQALDSFNVIEGKVGLGAEAMRALIIQAGHQILLEDIYDGTTFMGTKAECHRADWPDDQWRTYIFSMDDARTAGLLRESRSGRPTNWQTYPRAMTDARATSGAGRRYFPDVLAGMSYTPEEIRDFGGPADQEEPPSQSATATQNGQQPTAPPASAQSSTSMESSPLADALKASLATAPQSTETAGSTDSASATSPADTAAPAPPTASTSTAKKAGGTKKAAGRKAAAPSAPAPAASTPSPAPSATPSDSPGGAGVLREMAHALAEIIKGQPSNQQGLLRAFIREHFPEGIESITDQADMQKAIDIAVGWPDSANQHPAPLRGEEVWGGFSTKVTKVGEDYVMTCTLCDWQLEEAATTRALPDFRRLELSTQTAQQHETGEYQDGTPFCSGRPAQGRLET